MYQLGYTLLKVALKPTQTGLDNKEDGCLMWLSKAKGRAGFKWYFIQKAMVSLGLWLYCWRFSWPVLLGVLASFRVRLPPRQQMGASRSWPPVHHRMPGPDKVNIPCSFFFFFRKGLRVILICLLGWVRLDHLLISRGEDGVIIPGITVSQM